MSTTPTDRAAERAHHEQQARAILTTLGGHLARLNAIADAAETALEAERATSARLRRALISEHENWEAWVAEITDQQGKVDTSRTGTIALIRSSHPYLHPGDLEQEAQP